MSPADIVTMPQRGRGPAGRVLASQARPI